MMLEIDNRVRLGGSNLNVLIFVPKGWLEPEKGIFHA
jgi:hypothetical protein